MKRRIRAAWKVLRGEWDAQPKPATATFYVDRNLVHWTGYTTTTTTARNIRIDYRPR